MQAECWQKCLSLSFEMTDALWHSFLTLVRAGLWERDTQLPESLDAEQWRQLLEAGLDQAVVGLLIRGASHLPAGQQPDERNLATLQAGQKALQRTGARIAAVQAQLLAVLSEAGVHPLVQKGSEAAKYYLVPGMRQGGDIDLYCPEFDRARAIFPQARTAPDGAAVFAREGVTVELHPRYYDVHVDPAKLPVPGTPVAEILLLTGHLFKHAVGAGVGLKQCCDVVRALASLDGKYDKAALQAALNVAGMQRWHRLLCSLLVADLGLDPACCLPGFRPADPEPLRRIIRTGGLFGQSDPARLEALGAGPLRRKAATAAALLGRLPFSLRLAPREAFATIGELVRGNFRRL